MADLPNATWVETSEGVEDVVAAIAGSRAIALDTEADSLHSYFHKTCLIQVTAGEASFVIDPLALPADALAPLWRPVEDPGVEVLMHGADYDLRVLDRDYGVHIRGLLDTQIMAQLLGEPKTGLAALLDKELGITIDKRHQRADWGRRPLTPDQIAYAASDTANLAPLAARLRARLEALGRWSWAVEDCRRLEAVRHQPAEPDPLAFERIKGVRALRGVARDRAFSLFEWREGEAQRLDTPPFKVLGNATLIALADRPPAGRAELGKVDGLGPRFLRRWGNDVLAILDQPSPAPEWRRHPRPPSPPPAVLGRIKAMTEARDATAARLGLEPGLVCARSCLLEVASRTPPPRNAAELEAAGLVGWRLAVLGEPFLAALATA
ncbi:MAG: HRDC domain-containing protein [Thermoanaerobaculales bacterium]|jgi:ribonuclease D|nr:HRDC domain-containing protein [Thermoanaerobaculales bacterium]